MADYPEQIRGLQIDPAEDGVIIHESEHGRVHYLNLVAALVLGLCTGRNSSERIVELVQKHFGLRTPPKKDVSNILTNFVEEGLIKSHRKD